MLRQTCKQYEEGFLEEVTLAMMPKVYPGKEIGGKTEDVQAEGRSHAEIKRNGCRRPWRNCRIGQSIKCV